MDSKSNYEDYIFSSGLKFNRIEEEIDINGEEAKCNIQAALFLNLDSHQEIKTRLNHLKPNCVSYQKIKNVLSKNCKGAYQGKIFVKDIAQKTDAYQLSKALLLSNSSEFNAKPELEIYADDVKCSHGSTSGSMNEDSIFYLMTRGISRKKAIELLTKAFLFEVTDSITNINIKNFLEKNLDRVHRLKELISYFKKSIINNQYSIINSHSAIQCIVISGNDEVKNLAESVQMRGYDVRPILSPTVPKGEERLRICLHAFNTKVQIDGLFKAIEI